MKEASSSIDGVEFSFENGIGALFNVHAGARCAIIGTGTSMDNFDLSTLDDYDVTIGLNESIKWYASTYLAMIDTRCIAKVMEYVGCRVETTAVLSEEVIDRLLARPPCTPRGVFADREFAKMRARYSFKAGVTIDAAMLACVGGVLSAGLSLAKWVGAVECDLYGCDFYRLFAKKYAFTVGENPEHMRNVDVDGKRFITDAMLFMVQAIEQHKEIWSGMRVRNMNPLSELRCFEGGRRDEW